jgi:small conductance mechanosensitive channel
VAKLRLADNPANPQKPKMHARNAVEDLMASIREWLDPEVLWPLVFGWAGKIVAALLIFLIGKWVAAAIASTVAKATERAKIDPTLTKFLRSLIYMTLLIIVILTALGMLGVPTTNFLAILGAAGLAIGLALKDSLSNFSSGVMLIFFRPFKYGDYVEAGGIAGTVDAINIFNTVFKTPDNRVITVPNSLIYADPITNYSAMATRRIDLVIGISYDDDVVRAKEIIKSVLDKDERILDDPAPTIMMLDLADSSVNFAVRPWVASADYWAVRGDVLEQIKLRLEENGLSIPYPQRDVHLIGQVAGTA